MNYIWRYVQIMCIYVFYMFLAQIFNKNEQVSFLHLIEDDEQSPQIDDR